MSSFQPFFITFGISLVIAGYVYFNYFKDKVPKQFTTRIRLFTRRNRVYNIEAENRSGLLLPDSGPGYVEVQSALIIRRFGRLWKTCVTDQQAEAARKRETIYVTRENDPNPLTIGIGIDGGYQGEQVTHSTFKELSNLNQREAAATARVEGPDKDALANKLMIAVVIAVAGAIAAWGLYFLIAFLNGDPA